MLLYDNGEPVLKTRMEDEEWYGYYQSLLEIITGEQFSFTAINDPSILVNLFNEDWKGFRDNKHYRGSFPTDEQILRWSVLLVERHNNVYNSPKIIKAYRSRYAELETRLSDWTDWDVASLEVALVEKKTGFPEFFKDVKKGGLPKNKFWIYDSENPLTKHITHIIDGLVTLGILELHDDEPQWRWAKKE